VFVVGKGIRAQFKPVQAGKGNLLAGRSTHFSRIDSQAPGVYRGRKLNAVSETPVEAGQPWKSPASKDWTLKVKPKLTEKIIGTTHQWTYESIGRSAHS